MRTAKWIWTGAGFALLGGMVSACVIQGRDYPAHHFRVVTPGVLYRGGQPDRDGWRAIRDVCRVRTVVCLRGPDPAADWWQTERSFCRRNGIDLVVLCVEPTVRDAVAKRFYRIVTDPARWPVFVHCKVGSVRTGAMVAAYRMTAQGWTYEKALAEAETLSFDAADHKSFEEFLRDLSRR